MSSTAAIFRLASLFEFMSILAKDELSVSEIKAIIFVAISAAYPENPRMPNIADISEAIGLSHSATSRLLSGLSTNKIPALATDKKANDGRSEAFYLTRYGRMLLEDVLAEVFVPNGGSFDCSIYQQSIEDRVAAIKNNPNGDFGLVLGSWDEENLYLSVRRYGDKQFTDIFEWFADVQMSLVDISIEDSDLKIVFSRKAQAIVFMQRWGISTKNVMKFHKTKKSPRHFPHASSNTVSPADT